MSWFVGPGMVGEQKTVKRADQRVSRHRSWETLAYTTKWLPSRRAFLSLAHYKSQQPSGSYYVIAARMLDERSWWQFLGSFIMTKLLEWLVGVSLVGVAWGLVTFDLLDLQLPAVYKEVAWPMPVYLLVVFGCYSLATIGYRVATFNDCEEAAKELQAQIQEAKEDLKKKGLKM
ncbi:hypothetical protein SRHO_G00007710 [Serrasalmus rhombeus]